MSLSHFMLRNSEPISAQWVAFAATLLTEPEKLQLVELREHVEEYCRMSRGTCEPQAPWKPSAKNRRIENLG